MSSLTHSDAVGVTCPADQAKPSVRFAVSFCIKEWSVVMDYVPQSTDIVPAQTLQDGLFPYDIYIVHNPQCMCTCATPVALVWDLFRTIK